MATLSKNLIVSKEFIQKRGMVFLPLAEYEKIKEKIERLERERKFSQEEAEILRIIAEGEREYKEGKLKPIKSLAEIK
ncbi:hypothetical protein KAU51_01350 [Candidatus Parcubacteria bacterium]|nr:hypothetical protein [Candidatus Parcubacteria bacterium]